MIGLSREKVERRVTDLSPMGGLQSCVFLFFLGEFPGKGKKVPIWAKKIPGEGEIPTK